MMITIDLGGNSDDILVDNDSTVVIDNVKEMAIAEEQRRSKWMEWIRRNEQIVPQIVPVTSK